MTNGDWPPKDRPDPIAEAKAKAEALIKANPDDHIAWWDMGRPKYEIKRSDPETLIRYLVNCANMTEAKARETVTAERKAAAQRYRQLRKART
jgi:hypothetical protein